MRANPVGIRKAATHDKNKIRFILKFPFRFYMFMNEASILKNWALWSRNEK